jgi:putative spermidine/putrescine transport system substrate-binding protein
MTTKTTRRKFISHTAALGGGVAAASLGAPMIWAQSKPTTLNVGAWGGLWGEMIHGFAGESFERETGVKINYIRGGDSAKLAQMRAERGRQTMDVAYWTPTSASIIAREMNEVVPIAEKENLIPNLYDLDDASRDSRIWSEYGLPPWAIAYTLLYRTDHIDEATAAAVDSWDVVFDEQYRRRIGWPNINWGSGWGLCTLAMMRGAGTFETGKPHDVSPGWELVPQLTPQVLKFYDNDGEAEQLLRSGDTWITIRATFENSLFRSKGMPVNAWTNLKEGMSASNELISIIRTGDSEREDLAAQYINHALSPEAQSRLAQYFAAPMNPKAEVPAEYADQILSREEIASLNHFDWIWMGTQLDQWTEQWGKAIAG